MIPAQGSVGASGDLAPLGALGRGAARHRPGARERRAAAGRRGLDARRASSRLKLRAKEGLALINGTQVSTALALAGLFGAEDVLAAAVVAGAMSVDALKGSDAPFDERIHQARGQPGQIAVARALPRTARGQRDSRLAPRLHPGAGSLLVSLPAAGDGRLSGSDPPVQPHARASRPTPSPTIRCCSSSRATCSRAAIFTPSRWHSRPIRWRSPSPRSAASSERRMAVLVDPKMSGLPAFLVRKQRAQFGLHDRAGDRGRAGIREQGDRLPLQRRFHSDLRQPGGPRQHGHARRAAPGRHGRQRGRRRRHRIAGRGPGHRLSPPRALLGGIGGGARQHPRARSHIMPPTATLRRISPRPDAGSGRGASRPW